jgi:hypothetical protein
LSAWTSEQYTDFSSGDLTKDERLEYIRAVKCIRSKPSKLPAGKYPGAKSRYDDFIVVHMNMTPTVHSTANFMHWHRYYIWYESYYHAIYTLNLAQGIRNSAAIRVRLQRLPALLELGQVQGPTLLTHLQRR